MKKRLPTFLAGMLTAALIGGLGVTALAAVGQMTITVDPISIQVNGQTFQPKDATGNDVPVFSLNGTTYAPLRALAEAYGLTVGYDQAANMATVTNPNATSAPQVTPAPDYSTWTAEEEAAYLEFKGMWEIELNVSDIDGESYYAKYAGTLDQSALLETLLQTGKSALDSYTERLMSELYRGDGSIHLHFFAQNNALWRGYIDNGKATSLFDANSIEWKITHSMQTSR